MKFLLKKFVNNYENYKDANVRSAYVKVSSLLGIVLNIFLFLIKVIIGLLFHSVAIVGDALNSLSDSFNNIIGLISAVFAEKPADEDHPYGHERIEYLGSLFVSFVILLFAFSLLRESIVKIVHPNKLHFSWLIIVVMLISILIKLYMFYYNKKYANLIDSNIMKATALDSLSDCLGMSAIIIAMIFSYYTNFNLDGYMGIIVAIVIFKSGFEILKDTVNELLGCAPDPQWVEDISNKICSYEGILGVHDVIIHSYGPNRSFISAHAEVDSKVDIKISHDLIDNIEQDFKKGEHISLVLHMDPIDTDDEFTNEMRSQVKIIVKNIDDSLSIHDFRVVKGNTHNNLIFDIVIPYSCKKDVDDILTQVKKDIPQNGQIKNIAVINVDRC